MLTKWIFSPIIYGNQFLCFPFQSQPICNSACVWVSDSPLFGLPLWEEKWDPTTPWMHASAFGSPMLPDGAGLCPPPHSQIYVGLEKRFPSTWLCLMNQVPKWNQIALFKKMQSWEEIYLRKVTHTWKLKGCGGPEAEEVDAKENGQRSVGVTKEQRAHAHESGSTRASPDHKPHLRASLLGQGKGQEGWLFPAPRDQCWSPLLAGGSRQAKRGLIDGQI